MSKQNTPPPKLFTFALEAFNSAFGISADTFEALANSYGVSEENLIVRALTIWAKSEIPDLDLDSPALSEAQLKQLAERRTRLDILNNQPTPSLRDIFAQMEAQQGASDEPTKLVSSNGGDT